MLKFKILILGLFTLLLSEVSKAQINVNNIEIIRDEYGIPHIFTETDAEATYGIAWAQCEDNFNMLQDNFSIPNNLAGRIMGKKGAVLDYLYQAFEVNEFVNTRYEKDVSPEMQVLLESYVSAINRYAELHPEEIKNKKMFPIVPNDVLGTHSFHMLLTHSSAFELGKMLTKEFEYDLIEQAGKGSNAMAYSPNFTVDNKTYLIGNPHQPINTMGNWWEASVHSKEGYDMYGANFSMGGMFFYIGANRNLGWSHTTNYQNSADIYKLEMHPKEKYLYKYDDEWIPLEVKKIKLKVKIGPFTIPVKKKIYFSKFGPTFLKESGFYSYKSNTFHNIRIPEQWYKMGKAKNFEEFTKALEIQALPNQTVTYADKEGNIFHISNFTHPLRDESLDWTEVSKGNTSLIDGTKSIYNWTLDTIYPINTLPQSLNPKCGYVYNCNNTILEMTAPEENPKLNDFPKNFGIMQSTTIRAKTFRDLISEVDKISFEKAREIRENTTLDKYDMAFRNCMNCGDLPKIINKYPELANIKVVFDKWNGSYDIENKQAAFMVITALNFSTYIKKELGNEEKNIPEEVIVDALLKAEKFLLKNYKTLEVPLGDVQKAVRFDVEMPMYGAPNTLANCHVEEYKKGKVKIVSGDSFIFYAKYDKDGLETLETINAFGNSMKEGNPHSTDQTKLYVEKKTKPAILDLESLRKSNTSYHPK